MSRYLTLVVRLADNADARLVFEQVERINGVALSASSWSHVMDARDTLTAEVARLMGELERSRQECERMREDAERYRWLRDPSVYVGKVIDKVAGYEPMTELGTGGYPIYEYRAGPELDAAIDAAIAQENSK